MGTPRANDGACENNAIRANHSQMPDGGNPTVRYRRREPIRHAAAAGAAPVHARQRAGLLAIACTLDALVLRRAK